VEYDPIGAECLPAGNVAIFNPVPFSYLRGRIEITGTVKVENFSFFRLQYGKGLYPTEYFKIEGDRFDQVENGWLQFWNTAGLDGLYTLQLVAVKGEAPFEFETVSIPITVDNQPPTVSLLLPTPEQAFTAQDSEIVIQPQVADNLALAKVIFFLDGVAVGESSLAPYSTRLALATITRGPHTLYIRALDAAGNSADSAPVSVVVR
jgi:hypothetical protein